MSVFTLHPGVLSSHDAILENWAEGKRAAKMALFDLCLFVRFDGSRNEKGTLMLINAWQSRYQEKGKLELLVKPGVIAGGSWDLRLSVKVKEEDSVSLNSYVAVERDKMLTAARITLENLSHVGLSHPEVCELFTHLDILHPTVGIWQSLDVMKSMDPLTLDEAGYKELRKDISNRQRVISLGHQIKNKLHGIAFVWR